MTSRSYFNDDGEPMMTHSQMLAEQSIDEMNAEEDVAGLNDDYEHDPPKKLLVCRVCGDSAGEVSEARRLAARAIERGGAR